MYEVEGLKEGIKRAKINIQTFKDAVNRELETIVEYENMIKFIEEARDVNLSRPDSKS